MTPPPWSYSSLTAFETCPRRHYLTRVSKQVTDPPSEAIVWGNEVHKALELRIAEGTPLPASMVNYEPMVQKILSKSVGDVLTEKQLAITSSFQPAEWWGEDAWCRGVVDLTIVNGSTAVLLDWKTGKIKPDSDQLKLFAALIMAHLPEVTQAKTGFVWLKHGKVTAERYTREYLSEIWRAFSPRVKRLELAYQNDHWPAKPSGLCRAWCPVGRGHCEFCGQR
jgi:hypothetical protein